MIPYAPRERFSQPNRLSDLILRSGEAQADAHLRSGQIWGNTLGKLGGIASGYVEDRAVQKQEQAQTAELTRRDQAALAVMSNPDADPMEFVKIYGPREGVKVAQGFEAFKKLGTGQSQSPEDLFKLYGGLNAVSEKVRAAAYPTIVANVSKAIPALAGALPSEYSPEGWTEIGSLLGGMNPAKAGEGFTLSENQVRIGPDGKEIARGPVSAPKPDSRSLEIRLAEAMASGDTQAASAIKGAIKQAADAGRAPNAGKTENKMWVMRAGADGKMKSVFIPESQVQEGDQPANTRSGEGRPSLGGEKTALGFFNRAKKADEDLKSVEQQITSKGLVGQAYMALAPNFMQTQEGQAYQQAQRAFTEARLRKESGAAIADTEYANDRLMYFAQPGDSKETAAQKERARKAVLAGLAFQSGRALNEFYGDEADSLLEGYKAQQAGSKAPSAPAKPAASPKAMKVGKYTVEIEG